MPCMTCSVVRILGNLIDGGLYLETLGMGSCHVFIFDPASFPRDIFKLARARAVCKNVRLEDNVTALHHLRAAGQDCDERSRFWNLAAPSLGQSDAVQCCHHDGIHVSSCQT